MKAGRPSKFKPAYSKMLIDHLADGASISSFAAEIGVARSTVHKWAEGNEEFSDALKIGKAKCAAWWEKQLRVIAQTGGAPGAATAVIFGLKNMASDDWRDKQSHEHTGKDGGPIEHRTLADFYADIKPGST
ncbi:hypothetical protein [Hyphomonas sp. UBA4494]|uniref:hypothetical protein n=1 Tax=Hyphomonas sp. UBA4494 TaxID=1946631 RepID=UPI0025C39507|nr:hypothetical protein [Hyphomonas sp. UBA4494]